MRVTFRGMHLFRKNQIGSWYDKVITVTDDWFLICHSYDKTISSASIIHKPCYDHWMSKWPHCQMYTGRINIKTVSCFYCKQKGEKSIRKKLDFIFGI